MTTSRLFRYATVLWGALLVTGCQPEGYHSVRATPEDIAAAKQANAEMLIPTKKAANRRGQAAQTPPRRTSPGRSPTSRP